jgi:hypothetical protein
MSIDTYYAAAYWGARRESLDECARRATLLLEALVRVHDSFSNWYEKGRSRRDALRKPVPIQEDHLRALLARGRNRTDFGKQVIEEFGYSLSIWNGAADDLASSFSLRCGGWETTSPNSCVVTLPDRPDTLDPPLLTVDNGIRIIAAMAKCLNPAVAFLASREHRDMRARTKEESAKFVGWITFLPHDRAAIPPLSPADIHDCDCGGTIVSLSNEVFDASNRQHVARADDVGRLLAKRGILPALA